MIRNESKGQLTAQGNIFMERRDRRLERVKKRFFKKEVNMFWALVVGIISMAVLGSIPLFGPLLAGFIAGLIVRGAGSGALAGFLSGSIGGILAMFVLTSLGGVVGSVTGGLLGGVLGGMFGAIIGGGVFIATLYFGLLGLIGGALGGLVRPR